MRAIIIDDEQPAIDYLSQLLVIDGRVEIVGSFRNPREVLTSYTQLNPDVVFLDVRMPLMNGILLAKQLMAAKEDLIIVFVTARRDSALEAFNIHASDYLLKPLTADRLKRTIDRLLKAAIDK